MPDRAPLFIETVGEGPPALFLHGSFGYGAQAFPRQAPLGARRRLLLIDRRGFGRSPDAEPFVDFDVDADDLLAIAQMQGAPVDLVAHSYAAVPALLAANRRPDLLGSMVLIEPTAFALVRGDPAVEMFIERLEAWLGAHEGASAREFLIGFVIAMGYDPPDLPEPDPLLARSILASATERRPWDVVLDIDALRAARIPTLIVSGSWSSAPELARRIGGAAFGASAAFLERELPARRIVIPGAAHNPHMAAAIFNPAVETFWESVKE